MDLGKTVNNSWRQETIVKSLVWNAVVETFKESKDIDISNYLGSIKLKEKTIFIKTTKSILKSEMLLLDDVIKEKVKNKLKKVGVRIDNMEIKYI